MMKRGEEWRENPSYPDPKAKNFLGSTDLSNIGVPKDTKTEVFT